VATAGEQPTLDVIAGANALDEDIPRVLRVVEASTIEDLGWSRPDRLTLLVPMIGTHLEKKQEYLLRLGFQAYRRWPPSAQFVNPANLGYIYPQDQHYVPKLTSPECHTHVAYERAQGKIQLICCSATLEFYEVLHSVEPQHLWRDTYTFLVTIAAIQKALGSFYEGPF